MNQLVQELSVEAMSGMSAINIKTTRVVIYTTLRCPHCQHLKRWLKKNKVPFLDFNVGKPGKMQKQFFEIGGQSVPLIAIGDKKFIGFNPNQLKKALQKEGLIQE